MPELTRWKKFERISKVLQLVVLIGGVIGGVFSLVSIQSQIKQARLENNKNSFNKLWQLDARLREGKNRMIFLAIDHNKKIISKKITDDDLDLYLDDLCSIEEVYRDRLISMDDIYAWFADNIIETYENKEVKAYIANAKKEEPDCYDDFIDLYTNIQRYIKTHPSQ